MNRHSAVISSSETLDLLVSLCAHVGFLLPLASSSSSSSSSSPNNDKDWIACRAALSQACSDWRRHCTLRHHQAAAQQEGILRIQPNQSTNHDNDTDTASAAWLRQHEQLLSKVRVALDTYRASLRQQMRRVTMDWRALQVSIYKNYNNEEANHHNDNDQELLPYWLTWMQSVIVKWQHEIMAEQRAWTKWQEECLDTAAYYSEEFYSDKNVPTDVPLPQQQHTTTNTISRNLSVRDKVMVDRLVAWLLEHADDNDDDASVSSASVQDASTQLTGKLVHPQTHMTTRHDDKDHNKTLLLPSIHQSNFVPPSSTRETTIQQTVLDYFSEAFINNRPRRNRFFLLRGESGTGKTFLCQQIRQSIEATLSSSMVTVLSPRIPLDFLGRTAGGAEATWLSLLETIQNAQQGVLLILDSVDYFSPDTTNTNGSNDIVTGGTLINRLAAAWRHFLDVILSANKNDDSTTTAHYPVLVLGTCTRVSSSCQTRVDAVFDCQNPCTLARRRFLGSIAGLMSSLDAKSDPSQQEDDVALDKLELATEASLGRSYGEIALQARRVLSQVPVDASPSLILDEMLFRFQQHCPPSLSLGAEGLVDMQVLTGSHLGQSTATRQAPGSLVGSVMEKAWRNLQSLVIIPLCRSKELQALLGNNDTAEQKKMVGGVLLTGGPGCGKTALAYEAARYVASTNPAVKLISVSCTSLVHKEVGGSEKALHQLFVAVRQAAPCLVLMEGIETIAAVRGHDTTTEGTMDRVLSTLLVELDGIDSHDGSMAPFAVIGTTHDHRWVDPALWRRLILLKLAS